MSTLKTLIINEDLNVARTIAIGSKNPIVHVFSTFQLDDSHGSFVRLNIFGAEQPIILPVTGITSQLLFIQVFGGSLFGAAIQITNTNLLSSYTLLPGNMIHFMFDGNVWNALSGSSGSSSNEDDFKTTFLHMGA